MVGVTKENGEYINIYCSGASVAVVPVDTKLCWHVYEAHPVPSPPPPPPNPPPPTPRYTPCSHVNDGCGFTPCPFPARTSSAACTLPVIYVRFAAALPTLDIAEGALDKLFAIYKELLPSMGGYLNHAGELHRGRLEMILDRLAALELDTLEQRAQVGCLSVRPFVSVSVCL